MLGRGELCGVGIEVTVSLPADTVDARPELMRDRVLRTKCEPNIEAALNGISLSLRRGTGLKGLQGGAAGRQDPASASKGPVRFATPPSTSLKS